MKQNRNAKVKSIETEIENGEDTSEDVTGPNHIKMFLQLQPPSSRAASDDNAPARTRVWPHRGPREVTSQVLVDI